MCGFTQPRPSRLRVLYGRCAWIPCVRGSSAQKDIHAIGISRCHVAFRQRGIIYCVYPVDCLGIRQNTLLRICDGCVLRKVFCARDIPPESSKRNASYVPTEVRLPKPFFCGSCGPIHPRGGIHSISVSIELNWLLFHSMQTPFPPAYDLGPPPIELGCGDGSARHGHLFRVVLGKVAGRYA